MIFLLQSQPDETEASLQPDNTASNPPKMEKMLELGRLYP